jgi:purine-cytosine permease-like protein
MTTALLMGIFTPNCPVPTGILIIVGMIFAILMIFGIVVLSEYKKTVKKYVKTERNGKK